MKLNNEQTTINQTYFLKLKKSFQLIMNDLPDNRDDTINAKLLDSLKLELETKNELFSFLRSYLLDSIITCDKFKASIIKKEPEIIQFFIDLISVLVQSSLCANDFEFITRTLNFIHSYFETYFSSQFQDESIISCSILNLVLNLYDLINSSSDLARANNHEKQDSAAAAATFNNLILDKYLLSQDSLINHLHTHCKSIFVRKLYKQLLNKHLIYLVNNLHNQPQHNRIRERLENLITSISLLNYEIKLNNLDIYSNLIQYYFIQNNTKSADKSNEFKLVHQLFDFNADRINYLNNLISFTNDASIEAFTYTYVFNLLITFNKADDLFDQMQNELNEITSNLVSKSLHHDDKTPFKQSVFRKEIDHLFKFLIYFYSFLNQFQKVNLFEHLSSRLDMNSFEANLEKVKLYIVKLLVLPIDLSSSSSSSDEFKCAHLEEVLNKFSTRSYLDAISELNLKRLVLEQCLINLKLFIRKFHHFNLFVFVTSKQVVYILRHLSFDLDTKNKLLDILVDYYMSMSAAERTSKHVCTCLSEYNLISLAQLIDSFCELFHLKLNDTLNYNMLKLITIQFEFNANNSTSLTNNNNDNLVLCDKLVHLIYGRLDSNENLNVFLLFLTSLLAKSLTHLVVLILNSNSFLILNKCAHLVLLKSDSDDSLNELKDTIYQFYKNLFLALKSLKTTPDCVSVFTDEFVHANECDCLSETEAFMRRELVQFLVNYNLYKYELNEAAIDLVRVVNYFSRLLASDFDWQIQLYCLEYFESMIHNTMNKPSGSQLEVVLFKTDFLQAVFTALDDSDQHVVLKAAKLIQNLKANCVGVFAAHSHEYSARIVESSLDEKLNALIDVSTKTSDLYTLNPASILDDIISSYQFEIDDEKFIDCY